ncbi:hypothetical protein A2442_00320 [Candidatus Campbellbacteria bacterium RIFOXYC2_FULL_35_25]|uniref:Serine hydrolase family protein n=1 Tax=Candidatus Campbellbacteria bacterium RIFOXYC2_FULL_35_25 TaxID=1797582 RepID=A0A1F5EI09_9BACT|nr:MAG: hypothetical protein A2442_00320 [Candidatus Campbellbacteria bacterium RIFOXYC2_FULL_35_25]
MKKIFIIHGWDGTDWLSYAEKSFKKLGFEVFAPEMPDPETPKIDEWINYLKNITKDIDEKTIFIGHSIGCQTIMRFLSEQDKKVAGCVFVAGWFNLENLEDATAEKIAEPWIKIPINVERVKNNCGKIITILGDDDEWVPYAQTRKDFEEKLGSEVITLEGVGHITKEDGYEQFPELIEIIKKEF